MEKIIKKAIDGGWYPYFTANGLKMKADIENIKAHCMILDREVRLYFLEPLFWQALFGKDKWDYFEKYDEEGALLGESLWLYYAISFHEINLTEGWEKAVSYLESLIQT